MKIENFKKIAMMVKMLDDKPFRIEIFEATDYTRYELYFKTKKDESKKL